MKKIINGKMYNTETATYLGGWSNDAPTSDFTHIEEELYQKRTGEFFLYGFGGAMTKYAVSQGQNSWSGGSSIIPLSYESAMKWAEEKLNADDYERIFGEIPDNNEEAVSTTITLSASTFERAKREASKLGLSFSALVEKALSEPTGYGE